MKIFSLGGTVGLGMSLFNRDWIEHVQILSDKIYSLIARCTISKQHTLIMILFYLPLRKTHRLVDKEESQRVLRNDGHHIQHVSILYKKCGMARTLQVA